MNHHMLSTLRKRMQKLRVPDIAFIQYVYSTVRSFTKG
jgi:hypothetical protein